MPDSETQVAETPKRTVTKEKLRSIMEAASALTALGDEEDTQDECNPGKTVEEHTQAGDDKTEAEDSTGDKSLKRYIPDHKKPDAALTFPEKLMNLMRYADKYPEGFCIAWLQDGKSFVIRNPDDFTRKVLPQFFKATKFSSFTRKLYRWGFRQVNRGIGPDDPIIFGNEFFQRDDAELMAKMRSVTAAGARRAEQHRVDYTFGSSSKRSLDVGSYEDHERKRLLLDQLFHHKAASYVGSNMYGNQRAGLAQALRPSLGLGPSNTMPLAPSVIPGMMPKRLDLLNPNSLPSSSSLMNNFIPQGGLTPSSGPAQQYPNASTAEIVNAAINALRFAS